MVISNPVAFSDEERAAIEQAANVLTGRFGQVLGGNHSSAEVWRMLFGYNWPTFRYEAMNCHQIGVEIFKQNKFGRCWAATDPDGIVHVSTEFAQANPSSKAVQRWANHEMAHVVDQNMTEFYAATQNYFRDNGYYGSYAMVNYPGGASAASAAIPTDYRQAHPDEYEKPQEVFADALLCWALPECEFTDDNFGRYFDDLMADYMQARDAYGEER